MYLKDYIVKSSLKQLTFQNMRNNFLISILFLTFWSTTAKSQTIADKLSSIFEIMEILSNKVDSLNNLKIITDNTVNCHLGIIQKIIDYRYNTNKWPTKSDILSLMDGEKADSCFDNKEVTYETNSDTLFYFLTCKTARIGFKIFQEENNWCVHLLQKNAAFINCSDANISKRKRKKKESNAIIW